jgi:hypothetical protein
MVMTIGIVLAITSPNRRPVHAQATPPDLEGAFFRYSYQVPADEILFYHYDFDIKRGRGRYIPYEDNVTHNTMRRMEKPMTCRMEGLTCNLCCGRRGTLGGDPNARHTITIAPDGRSAIYRFTKAGRTEASTTQVMERRN